MRPFTEMDACTQCSELSDDIISLHSTCGFTEIRDSPPGGKTYGARRGTRTHTRTHTCTHTHARECMHTAYIFKEIMLTEPLVLSEIPSFVNMKVCELQLHVNMQLHAHTHTHTHTVMDL